MTIEELPKQSPLDKLSDIALQYQATFPQLVTQVNKARMDERQRYNMARMDAQVDAEIKKCNPDYKPPEPPEDDDVANNFLNGVFIGSEEMTSILQAEGNTAVKTNGRWWKTLLGVLLGSLLVLLSLLLYRYLIPPSDSSKAYSIIAVPFEPPTAQILP